MNSDAARVVVHIESGFDGWRAAARQLLAARVDPRSVVWFTGPDNVTLLPPPDPDVKLVLSRRFIDLAARVASPGSPATWALLYRLAYRLVTENRELLSDVDDVDVAAANVLDRALGAGDSPPAARQEPASKLNVENAEAPAATPLAMHASSELPAGLATLFADTPGAVRRMSEVQRSARSAAPFLPADRSLPSLAATVQRCEGCDLASLTNKASIGEGAARARVVIVGEQPDDAASPREFGGPSGGILDRALDASGLDRAQLYVTTAVKHEARDGGGSRTPLRSPRPSEIVACRPWLDAELDAVQPEVIVCLGAIAARALVGPSFRLIEERGEFVQTKDGRTVIATIHPAAILRASEEWAAQYQEWLVADLTRVTERLQALRAPSD